MNKRILLFDLAKFGLILCVAASLVGIAYFSYWLVWFLIQWTISPAVAQFGLMLQVADALPETLHVFTDLAHALLLGTAAADAKGAVIRFALFLAGSIALLLLARRLLRKLDYAFKRCFMPMVLQEQFSELSYEPQKCRSQDEPLCEIGLLHYIERYYSANRLKGLYRGCWVAAEEIVCGGVYLNHYTSHRVKVRGQWITIRLNRDFDAAVILESKNTRNRFSHQSIAARMVEVQFDNPAFAAGFTCYTEDPDLATELIDTDMAEKLLRLQDRYPDLCVILNDGNAHFLVRRRAFDRRWEALIPYCLPYLRRIANDLYGPLQDITDELLR